MVDLYFYFSQNPFFLIASFLAGFVLPYFIFYKIKEDTGNTLITILLASIFFGIIYQFQDILFKTIPLQASLFYIGFWSAILLSIIKAGAAATFKAANMISPTLKKIASYTKNLVKETSREIKRIREERQIIKRIRKELSYGLKIIFKDPAEAIKNFKIALDETIKLKKIVAITLKEEIKEDEIIQYLEKWENVLDKYRMFHGYFFKYVWPELHKEVSREEMIEKEIMELEKKEENILKKVYYLLEKLEGLIRLLILGVKGKEHIGNFYTWYNHMSSLVNNIRIVLDSLEKYEDLLYKLSEQELNLEKKLEKEEKHLGNLFKKMSKLKKIQNLYKKLK